MIQANSDGAAIKNIASVAVLKDLLLKIPPLSEQQAIVTHLDTLSEKLKTVEEKQKAIMAECDAMKQALLREVFA
ncbi:MAG: restriction endonuclease subunit S [Prevotella sp.]|nr:restriction endonuclease subunit S [Prevotella sp.]